MRQRIIRRERVRLFRWVDRSGPRLARNEPESELCQAHGCLCVQGVGREACLVCGCETLKWPDVTVLTP